MIELAEIVETGPGHAVQWRRALAAHQALRVLIEMVLLTPGVARGEIFATLHGEFGMVLDWTGR